MLKRDEISNKESCFNRCKEEEDMFVLLERDPAKYVAIQAWIVERLRIGKSFPDSPEIIEARGKVKVYRESKIPEFLREEFESGWVSIDDPPGIEKRYYELWKRLGGEVTKAA